MKKILQSFNLLLFACFLLVGSMQEARASHLLGGDMTYVSLGNNQYRVKFRLYRDCTGIIPSDFVLSCSNNGCNGFATVSALLVQQGQVEAGNPFCAAVSAGPCQGPTGLPNYDVYNYLATVTLPPGQWTLSTTQGSRPSLANIIAGNLYVQATLDNRNSTTGAAVANNSPQFDVQDIPIQYVCWRQPTTITYSSTEADGDSVVYSLTAPLEACGTPATYNSYPGGTPGGVSIIRLNPLCVFQQPITSGNYSPMLPIPVGYDTVGVCPVRTGTPRFVFNQQARTISFTPSVYVANSAAALGLNKYQIAVLITEYRRINGVRRIIGTVRREANLIVTDCAGNSTPNPVVANPITVNSGTVALNTTDTTQLVVASCSYSRVQLNFTDPDNITTPTHIAVSPLQLLTVTLPADINTNPNLLDSGDVGTFTLSGNGTSNPKGTFFFQPSPSMVGRTIRVNIRIEDNACPIKGVQNRVVVIRIRKGNFATALASVGSTGLPNVTPVTLCSGTLNLRGAVARPDSVRRLVQNISVLQTYSYQWTLMYGNGFNTATASTQNITVTPTMSSRYRLQITPNSGFGPGCGDTTSILVRVAPPVVSRFTITDSISNRPRTNFDPNVPAGGLIPPITYKFSNASTINNLIPVINGLPATGGYASTVFKMDSIRWTYQRIKDGAGQVVTSAPRVFSRTYNPGNLVLAEGGTYIIALSSSSTLIASTATNHSQCPASVVQRLVIVPELNVPNIITPNNDNLNDVFMLPVSQRGGKLEIYNRWGRKVQEYANYQNTWGGGDQPSGVYYYYLTDLSGNKSKGWVEVNRGL